MKNILLYIGIAILVVVNGITNCHVTNLILTIPEYFVVVFLITRKQYVSAMFYHFVFFCTSYDYNLSDVALSELNVTLVSYNYAKFKIASIPVFFVILLYLLISLLKDGYKFKILHNDFGCYHTFIKYILISGLLIGTIGLVLFGYYFEGFLRYGSYAVFVFIHVVIYSILYDTNLRNKIYNIIPPVIIICIFVPTTFTLLGIDVIGVAMVSFFSAILLPYMLFEKKVLLPFLALLLAIFNSITIGTGGKMIVQFLLFFLLIQLLLFTNLFDKSKIAKKRARLFKMVSVFLIVLIPLSLGYIFLLAEDSNFSYKLHNVQTLFGFFVGSNSLFEIDRSPYIRMAELINILYEDMINPVFLFFGRGFGGYYEDSLHLFNSTDISYSTFNDEQLRNAKYYTGHDAFVTIPMLNGFIGVFFWLKALKTYVKNMGSSYLKLGAISFLLLIFYYESLIGVIGTTLLYASDKDE